MLVIVVNARAEAYGFEGSASGTTDSFLIAGGDYALSLVAERPQDGLAGEERSDPEVTLLLIAELRTTEERAGMLQLLILGNFNSRTPLHDRSVEQLPTTAMAS